MKKDFFVVLCTAGVIESEQITRLLVEEKLAACVNVAEVDSYFKWKGEFCEDREALLIIKTEKSKVDKIKERYQDKTSTLMDVSTRKDPFLTLISYLLSLRTRDEVTAKASERLFTLAKVLKRC